MAFVKIMARVSAALLFASVVALPIAASGAAKSTDKQKMKELGLRHHSAWELYTDLKKKANGGAPLTWKNIPDWGGVYTRTKGGTAYDPDGPDQGLAPTAKFTPAYQAALQKEIENRKNGIEYDPLSQCVPPGMPRWFDLPFLRQHIVTPEQTTMIAEAFNIVRMIYTDGRDHIPVEDRYPTETGDSIGFWDGDKLIVHTNQMMAHIYERAQGHYSEEVETVEVWRKVDDKTLEADVWVYDPPALQEPWYTKQSYTKLDDPDKQIRLRHWACKGNPNNEVIETKEGGSQFKEFDFEKKGKKDSATGTAKEKSK